MKPISTMRAGFTLIEIMIAIAIVGILAFTVVPFYTRYINNARRSTAEMTLRQIKNAITTFNAEMHQYPTRLRDLVKKPQEEELAKKWTDPFLEVKNQQIPLDPWKNAYQYKLTPGQPHDYELFSYGPKGKSASKKDRISVWDL